MGLGRPGSQIGAAFGLSIFAATDGGVMYAVFLVYMLCMTSAAFVLSTFLSTVRVSSLVGIAALVIGVVLAVVCQNPSENPVMYIWWERPVPQTVQL